MIRKCITLIAIVLCFGCARAVSNQTLIVANELCKDNRGIDHLWVKPAGSTHAICMNGADFEVPVDHNGDPKLNRDKAIMDKLKSAENDVYRAEALKNKANEKTKK